MFRAINRTVRQKVEHQYTNTSSNDKYKYGHAGPKLFILKYGLFTAIFMYLDGFYFVIIALKIQ